MNLFELYQHVNNTDVAIMPVDHFYFNIGGMVFTKYRIRWYNVVNPHNVFAMSMHTHHVVMNEDQEKNWRKIA